MRKLTSLLIALTLLAGTVYAQDAEVEEGGAIAVGDVVEGTFEPGARVRYTLEVEEDQSLNIYLDGDENMDTYLRIYNEDEAEPFVENDDRGDGTLYSAVYELEVEAGTTLVIEVGTFGDEGEGAYSLRVTPPPSVEDAGTIAVGEPVEGELTENTRQRYTLTVEEPAVLNIRVDSADDLDTYLRLYREGEDEPAVQNDDASEESTAAGVLYLSVPGDTTLVIEVGAFADAAGGAYTLDVSESVVQAPETTEPVALGEASAADLCEDAIETVEPARLQYLQAEDVLDEATDYGAVFCTEAGAFLIDLYEAEAPLTVNSFVFLATNGFFDRTTFHRVIEDFVVQGGDPTGTGFGGPGYEFVNETDNELTFGGIGVVGMANAGPDTNGSQFFITLAPVERLDGGYTIFGQVLEGIASVTDIEVRDPGTATEAGTELYTVQIVTLGE